MPGSQLQRLPVTINGDNASKLDLCQWYMLFAHEAYDLLIVTKNAFLKDYHCAEYGLIPQHYLFGPRNETDDQETLDHAVAHAVVPAAASAAVVDLCRRPKNDDQTVTGVN